jgi:putative FmdB family regulatory protein
LPTYEYRCVSCEHQFERFQRMSDEAVKVCEVCGEPVKRLLFPVAIQFKGNGFYSTDYARRSALGSVGSHANSGGDSESSAERSSVLESTDSPDNGKAAASKASASAATGPTAKSD